jgi:hypothetical protein
MTIFTGTDVASLVIVICIWLLRTSYIWNTILFSRTQIMLDFNGSRNNKTMLSSENCHLLEKWCKTSVMQYKHLYLLIILIILRLATSSLKIEREDLIARLFLHCTRHKMIIAEKCYSIVTLHLNIMEKENDDLINCIDQIE